MQSDPLRERRGGRSLHDDVRQIGDRRRHAVEPLSREPESRRDRSFGGIDEVGESSAGRPEGTLPAGTPTNPLCEMRR